MTELVINMAIWYGKSRRKKSGGLRFYAHKKKKFEIGRETVMPVLGDTRRKTIRTQGGGQKIFLLAGKMANVYDPSKGVTKRVEITDVVRNSANPHYVRRNILTKGAIIETKLGKARITSRPGQHGVINAVLFKSKA